MGPKCMLNGRAEKGQAMIQMESRFMDYIVYIAFPQSHDTECYKCKYCLILFEKL